MGFDPTAAARAVGLERRRTARGTADPNPGASRLVAPLGALPASTTITVTPGAANAASVISGGVTLALTDTALTYLGTPGGFGSSFPDTINYCPDNIASWDGSKTLYASGVWAVEFEWYGQKLELWIKGVGSTARYRLSVLDQQLSTDRGWDARSGRADPANTGSGYRILYDFGSADHRRIRFDMTSNLHLYGITIGAVGTDAAWKTSAPQGPRVLFFGDSFVDGTGASTGFTSLCYGLAERMGWRNMRASGAGGTGYLNTNNGNKTTYRTRLAKDLIAWNPEIVILEGGLNDQGLFTAAAIQAEAALVYAQIRAALPTAKLIVWGCNWPRGGPPVAAIQIRDALYTASLGVADLFVDSIGGPRPYSGTASNYNTSGWITGFGNAGTPTGQGNSDIFTSADSTHPSQIGHDYYARRLASAIAAALPL